MKRSHKIVVLGLIISCLFPVCIFTVPPLFGYTVRANYVYNSSELIVLFGPFAVFLTALFFVVRDITAETGRRFQKEAEEQEKLRQEVVKRRQAEAQITKDLEAKIEKEKQTAKMMEQIKNYETAGRYEDAARLCDYLNMYEKAGELRRMDRTRYTISTSFNMGKDGTISCSCPTCGSSQTIESKTNLVTCKHCGNNYIIPKKVIDML